MLQTFCEQWTQNARTRLDNNENRKGSRIHEGCSKWATLM